MIIRGKRCIQPLQTSTRFPFRSRGLAGTLSRKRRTWRKRFEGEKEKNRNFNQSPNTVCSNFSPSPGSTIGAPSRSDAYVHNVRARATHRTVESIDESRNFHRRPVPAIWDFAFFSPHSQFDLFESPRSPSFILPYLHGAMRRALIIQLTIENATCEPVNVADCERLQYRIRFPDRKRGSRALGRVCQYSDEYANIPAADNEALRTRVDSGSRGLMYDVSLRSSYMLVRS